MLAVNGPRAFCGLVAGSSIADVIEGYVIRHFHIISFSLVTSWSLLRTAAARV